MEKSVKRLLTTGIFSLALFIALGIVISVTTLNIDQFINALSKSIKTQFLTIITGWMDILFDTKSMLILSLLLCTYLWIRRSKRDSLFFLLVMSVDAALLFLLKMLFGRTRPLDAIISADDYAFPSGHTASAVVFFSLLAYLLLKKQRSVFTKTVITSLSISIVLLIGLSRLYLNVHWFTDVIGGLLLGSSIVLLSLSFRKSSISLLNKKYN